MQETHPNTFFRYIPASPRDEVWGLVVTNAGFENIEPGMDYPPPGHPSDYTFSFQRGRVLNEFQLHFIPEGGGIFESEPSGRKVVEPGDFFLLFPGVRHRYRPNRETGWDEYWIGFEGDLGRRLLENGIFSRARPVIRARMERRALEQFSDLLSLLRAEPPGFMPVISSITTLLLSRLFAETQAQFVDNRADKIIRRTKEALRRDLGEAVDLEALAREYGVSYSWLRKTFREVTGLAPYQYRLKLRLGQAMDLLADPDCSVKQAAALTGFEDEHYFSRLFKKKTGLSPTAWQKQTHG